MRLSIAPTRVLENMELSRFPRCFQKLLLARAMGCTIASSIRNSRPGSISKENRGCNSAPRASNVLKRPHVQRGVLPVSSSHVKQSQGNLAQRIDLVVISDMEQEPGRDDKN
jgi:hypothetical protein